MILIIFTELGTNDCDLPSTLSLMITYLNSGMCELSGINLNIKGKFSINYIWLVYY